MIFGTADGREIHAITIGSDTLQARILTWGAVLQDVRLADVPYGLTLNSEHLDDYQGHMGFFGSLVGPVANRLTDAKASIAGVPFRFAAAHDDRHFLHSGVSGLHNKVWEIDLVSSNLCELSVFLPNTPGNLPGNRKITARFEVSNNTLFLTITATTDAPTLMNVANHSYWNLDGSDNWEGHSLCIAADHYLPITDEVTPTGKIADVSNTPFDFRTTQKITPLHPALDHNFCLSHGTVAPRDVLTLTGKSGVSMTLATNQPGIQVFDGRDTYNGIAIEAQGWPDAPNNPAFPGIELTPGQTYKHSTSWTFSAP